MQELQSIDNEEEREDEYLRDYGLKRLNQDFSDLPVLKLKCEGSLACLKGKRETMEDAHFEISDFIVEDMPNLGLK